MEAESKGVVLAARKCQADQKSVGAWGVARGLLIFYPNISAGKMTGFVPTVYHNFLERARINLGL